MKETLQHEKYGQIEYEENFWTGKKSLSINGEALVKLTKNSFQTASGEQINVKGNYLTGVSLAIGTDTVKLGQSLKWYEIVLSVLPFILIMVWGSSGNLCEIVPVVGGAVGGAVSGLFSVLNLIVIKGIKSIWLKILISVGILAVTFLICYAIGAAIVGALA